MEWHNACHGDNVAQKKRVFVNTVLAETDEDETSIEPPLPWEPLYARREDYITEKTKAPIVPEPVRVITAGADVQQNRVEILFQGWGKDEQCWDLEHAIIYGDPTNEQTWDVVEAAVQRRFAHPSGAQIETSITFIDRGKWTDAVDRFAARKTLSGKVWTCKGASENGRPIVGRAQRTGRGGYYFRLGTDAAKEYIMGKLAMDVPGNGKYLPGFRHFPSTFDPEFFKQLTAEQAKTVYERGRQFRKYIKANPKAANEALDLSVYSLAAFRVRQWEWDAIEQALSEAVKPADPKPKQRAEEDEESFVTAW
jgi:phage terminase large subunit GpA-like protein